METKKTSNIAKMIFTFLPGSAVLILLFIVSQYNYLFFHTLAESFSIMVAWSIFIIVWNTKENIKNDALVFLGIAYVFIGGLDLLHMLSYKGMGILGAEWGANPATQLWIIARYMESISLCLFILFFKKRINLSFTILIYSIVTALLLLSIFSWGIFPDCYIEGVGLTIFKKSSEYLICIWLMAAFFFLSRKKDLFDQTIYKLMAMSIGLAIIGELAFTFYISVYGVSNLIGHFFKIISFYLIYKAIIYTGLKEPYNLMFKEISDKEKRYRQIFETNQAVKLIINPLDGSIVEANNAACRFYGYAKDELISLNISDINILSPDKIIEEMNKAKSGNKLFFKFQQRLASGEIRDVGVYSGPIQYGQNTFLYSIIHDVTEHKRIYDGLMESEERFKKLSNFTFEGILIHRKGIVIDINEAFSKILGYTKKELIGKNIIDELFIPHEHHALVKENIIKNKALPYEIMAKKKDGGLVPIEIESKNIRIDNDDFRVTAVRDISERKKARQALRRSEQELRSIFRVAPTGIGVVCDRVIQQANDRLCEMTGYSRNELTGQNARILYPSDEEYEYVGKEKYEQISHKGTGTVETKWQCKDGKIMNIILSSTPIDPDDLSKRLTFTALDITDLKTKESELSESKEKYRSIMEAMDDAAYICSSEYRVEYMNPAMIKKTGRDATGEFCHKVIYCLDKKCSWCVHEKVIQGQTIKTEITSPEDNKSYHVSHSPVSHTDGSVSMLSVFRDLTEIKKMEARIQQSQRMEAIGTLAGGIAHDFNNILFPIIGHTEMLLEDVPKDSPLRNSLNSIYTGGLRASDLVKQILTFSRQENTELRLMKLQPIVKETLKLIRSSIPATIEIKQDINAECGAIKADPTQIHQIVMNLSTNAYHAMEEIGGSLTVSLKEMEISAFDLIGPDMTPGGYARLSIADTGTGMDKKLTDKIFDPFFTTKEKGKGTGMGLSVVHGIVKSLNGAIQVNSELGEGTEVHVYFPVEESLYVKQNPSSKINFKGGTEKILLVDDEKPILAMEKQMLERMGYQVTARNSGIKALKTFSENPDKFNLVITDMAMPNMPGDKLAVELIRIHPGIPILLCTGFSEIMTEEKAAALGIKGFLLKPMITKDLAQKIREVLDKKLNSGN